ncbi:kinase-like domain-containing protein [Aspergillus sergii]|uniref:Kinase-like domain-containing protein n=1 Tax=Aspergillus sergii TaxID=1034303 RepID=A0A5N6XMM5_9EURO|nr:kinase-like domain-containing protein [Aspergillus sergii]
MKFLAANSKVPVPKVYATFKEPETKITFIIMEYIPGDNLQTLLPSLTPRDKANICQLIRTAIIDLRSIPPPEYLGGLDHRPYNDDVFWNEGLDPEISGPFADQEEMNKGLLRKLGQSENPPYVQLLQNMVDTTLHGHRTVFTHGDLQPKNIMVERTGSYEDGCHALKSRLLIGKSPEIAG